MQNGGHCLSLIGCLETQVSNFTNMAESSVKSPSSGI